MLLRNPLCAGIVDVSEYRVRSKCADFEPLISEDPFYCVQSVLSGRLSGTTPQRRAHPDFLLRAFLRCGCDGRRLTGSWSRRGRIYGPKWRFAKARPDPDLR